MYHWIAQPRTSKAPALVVTNSCRVAKRGIGQHARTRSAEPAVRVQVVMMMAGMRTLQPVGGR
jgi:hypothetical protein